jgi:hypothetical protein
MSFELVLLKQEKSESPTITMTSSLHVEAHDVHAHSFSLWMLIARHTKLHRCVNLEFVVQPMLLLSAPPALLRVV